MINQKLQTMLDGTALNTVTGSHTLFPSNILKTYPEVNIQEAPDM